MSLLHIHMFGSVWTTAKVIDRCRHIQGSGAQQICVVAIQRERGPSTKDDFLKRVRESYAKRLPEFEVEPNAVGAWDAGFAITARNGSRLLLTEAATETVMAARQYNFPNELPSAREEAWSLCRKWFASAQQRPIPESMSTFLSVVRLGEAWASKEAILCYYLDHCRQAGVHPETQRKFWNRVKAHFLLEGSQLRERKARGPKGRLMSVCNIADPGPALQAIHLNALLPSAPAASPRARL